MVRHPLIDHQSFSLCGPIGTYTSPLYHRQKAGVKGFMTNLKGFCYFAPCINLFQCFPACVEKSILGTVSNGARLGHSYQLNEQH